jgi:hypothetical protein
MGVIRLAILALAVLLVAAASSAHAQRVPPGLSGANQYVETLPGVTGGEPIDRGRGGREGETPAEVLGHTNAGRLNRLGPAGRAAARLAAATAPEPIRSKPGGTARATRGAAGDPAGSSGVGQILTQLTGASDTDGMGLLLPLLIAMAGIAAAAFGIGRRRTARRSQMDG